MYKKYYSYFLQQNSGTQHYAAHSHHYWPDVTREATLQYWDDSAKYVDEKWNYFFTKKIPAVQSRIAEVLNLSKPEQLVFAPNTHEFVYRILSCFNMKKEIRILTTDSEFYSFERQSQRLLEDNTVNIDKVPAEPFSTFESRFIEKIKHNKYDLIFFSHVFFNSGFATPSLERIVDAVADSSTVIVVDGYHGFMALPTDLSTIENRIFYLSGSYKYAQGGEGCCFLHVPTGCQLRPSYTGWFAGFSELTDNKNKISYPDDGLRFAGSTMDFTALYRLHSVLELFKTEGITVQAIHQHIQILQKNFLTYLNTLNCEKLSQKNLVFNTLDLHGHFLTFEFGSHENAKNFYALLQAEGVKTDFRSSRLRFGFGLYQNDQINLEFLRK